MDFHGFRRYVFSMLRNEKNFIIYLSPFNWPRNYDLGWLWMAWMFIIRYSIATCDLAFSNFLLTYLL